MGASALTSGYSSFAGDERKLFGPSLLNVLSGGVDAGLIHSLFPFSDPAGECQSKSRPLSQGFQNTPQTGVHVRYLKL